jgi:hypothetical protein
MYHKIRTSANLAGWTDVAPGTIAYDTSGSWTDETPAPGKKYSYRPVLPALRRWNTGLQFFLFTGPSVR